MRRPTANFPELFDGSGFCFLGAETLLSRTEELKKQMEGVRKNDDVEYVHKLRVGSRRVRAALGIFEPCFQRKRGRKWKKTIKNLTRSAGAARDADVQIAFLEDYSSRGDQPDARALDYLITLQKARRAGMQSDVVKTLDDAEASGILEDILDSSTQVIRGEENSESNIKTLPTYQKAYNQISTRLDEVQALEQFVHDENAITKHHELRIAAKRLRYTMEIFSPIYTDGLKDNISLMKQYQDALGEIHDYDVWAEALKADIQDIPSDARYGVNKLRTYLVETRKSRYRNFIQLWDDTAAKGLFAKLRQVTDTGPRGDIMRELLDRDMKLALISDIHGNLDALKAVVEDAKKTGLEVFLNAGDAVGFGIYPSQVVQALRSAMFVNVIGNVDLEVLQALRDPKPKKNDGTMGIAIKELSPSDVAYLQSLPKELRLEIDGRKVLVTHGTPDSIDEHIYPDSPEQRLREIAAKANADVIITGHSHMQMNRNVDGVTFVNPGTVGRPVDGDPKAEYAVLNLNPLTVEFRRVNYDVETLADEMRKRGLPESHAQVQLRAIPLNVIRKQEEALAKNQLWKTRSTITKVRNVAKSFLIDESHIQQDRKLALAIFDKTKQLHSLGKEERYWLECAALLHDIGLSKGRKGHHKSSLRLILNDPALPFTQKERYIIGSIARYHRKALPNKKHFNLAPLSKTEMEKVAILSSVLRVADALDYSHKSIIRRVNVRLFPNHILLECAVSGNYTLEDQSFRKKKDLFKKVFKSDLTVVWKLQQVAQARQLR
jgi:putative phosphoesterase